MLLENRFVSGVRAGCQYERRAAQAAAISMLSSTLISAQSCGIWKERATPRRMMARGPSAVMSRPSSEMEPRSGLRYPVIMLTNVVLPAPFEPIRPTRSPAATSTLTPSAATTPSKCLDRFLEDSTKASWHEADHHQQEDAERQLPGVGEVGARERAHQLEQERGSEDRDDAVVPRQDRDEHEFAGSGPVAEVGLDVTERHDGERAAHAAEERREDEIRRHDAAHRGAEVLDAQLVLADGERHEAARRVEVAPRRDGEPARHDDRHRVEGIACPGVGDAQAGHGGAAHG